MKRNIPRKHHYVPQFFLRNFAVDERRNRITTVAKHGSMAIWAERSIESLGYEQDFYVHMKGGMPISVETHINCNVEIPISRSETWKKIITGRPDLLDISDKPILYALIRHLEARTPHYQATVNELSRMAADPDSDIPFTEEERVRYATIRYNPDFAKAMLNRMAATTEWSANDFAGAFLMIFRSPIPLRSSTTPVISIPAPMHEAMSLLPGMTPFQRVLTLNPYTIACLVLGDFDGAFTNEQMDENVARAFNRHFVGHFAHFDHVRHLISSRDALIEDMTWAPYELINNTERKASFRRQA